MQVSTELRGKRICKNSYSTAYLFNNAAEHRAQETSEFALRGDRRQPTGQPGEPGERSAAKNQPHGLSLQKRIRVGVNPGHDQGDVEAVQRGLAAKKRFHLLPAEISY